MGQAAAFAVSLHPVIHNNFFDKKGNHNMKKYISAAVIAAMLLTIAGCSTNNSSSAASGDTSTSSTVEESTSSTTSESTTTSETTTESSVEESTPEESKPEESAPEESTPEESKPEESTPEESTPEETPNQSESKCDQLANAAMTAVEFPAMGIFDDVEALKDFYSIDVSLCDEYAFYINLMSTHLNEVIVLKPAAGNEETLSEQIKAHLEYQKENGVWYPAQEESVAGAVWGVTPGGYIYLVIHPNGQAAADAIIAAE